MQGTTASLVQDTGNTTVTETVHLRTFCSIIQIVIVFFGTRYYCSVVLNLTIANHLSCHWYQKNCVCVVVVLFSSLFSQFLFSFQVVQPATSLQVTTTTELY